MVQIGWCWSHWPLHVCASFQGQMVVDRVCAKIDVEDMFYQLGTNDVSGERGSFFSFCFCFLRKVVKHVLRKTKDVDDGM